MKRLAALLTFVSLFGCALVGCGEDPVAPEPELVTEIEAGTGLVIAGNALALGDTLTAIETTFGSTAATRDLGGVGTQIDYPDLGVGGLLSGDGDEATLVRITVYPGFEGTTTDGVGLGSTEAEVNAAFGAAETDPFQVASWYSNAGVAVEWDDGRATRIHIFVPGSAW